MTHRTYCAAAALIGAVLVATPVAAQRQHDRDWTPPKDFKPLAAKTPAANPCAAFGAGFVQMAGSSSCIKVGGAISVGVGAAR